MLHLSMPPHQLRGEQLKGCWRYLALLTLRHHNSVQILHSFCLGVCQMLHLSMPPHQLRGEQLKGCWRYLALLTLRHHNSVQILHSFCLGVCQMLHLSMPPHQLRGEQLKGCWRYLALLTLPIEELRHMACMPDRRALQQQSQACISCSTWGSQMLLYGPATGRAWQAHCNLFRATLPADQAIAPPARGISLLADRLCQVPHSFHVTAGLWQQHLH